jgi:RNA-binding protein 39
VGKISDIKIVRDSKTGKSKGIAFVEFFQSESIEKALLLNGKKLLNQQIIVKLSDADRNRGHLSNRCTKKQQAAFKGVLSNRRCSDTVE